MRGMSAPAAMAPPAKRPSVGRTPTPGLARTATSTPTSGLTRTSTSTPISSGASTPVTARPGGMGRLALKPGVGGGGSGSQRSSPDRRLSRTADTAGTSPASSAAGSRPPARRHTLAPASSASSLSSRTSPVRAPAPASAAAAAAAVPAPPLGPGAELMAVQRENEDLRSKVKVLEKKRLEDREARKALARTQDERDKLQAAVVALQQRYQPQVAELDALRVQLRDMEAAVADVDALRDEHDALLEMATLDREMAEEQAEAYKAELDAVRDRAEELALEADLLREEKAELEAGSDAADAEHTSAGWLHMARQNERLKEALLRLREMTAQTEAELRGANAALEEEAAELPRLRERCAAADAAADDLRQQLEAALGADELLEELAERNLALGEHVDELRATVDDLESLRELSDELELNRAESERQLQAELDDRDRVVADQARHLAVLAARADAAEHTVLRFRELVVSLQADLGDLRAARQLGAAEADALAARSRAVLGLNLQLQLSAAKAQAKTIDLELRRLDAAQAAEHLAIVQVSRPSFSLSLLSLSLSSLFYSGQSLLALSIHPALPPALLRGTGTRSFFTCP